MKNMFRIPFFILFYVFLVNLNLTFAHDNDHGSKDSHKMQNHDEGSGMRKHSGTKMQYKEKYQHADHIDDKHNGNSSEYIEEGSNNLKMHSQQHGQHENHNEYNDHGKSSEHMEEGSGMR